MDLIKISFRDEKEAKRLFQKLLFYNVLIGKPCIKHLKNRDLPHELPFYDRLSIAKMSQAFARYAKTYKIEIRDSKDPLAQLEAGKSSIEHLFKALFDESKSSKYQITVKALLRKHKKPKTQNLLLFILIYY